jgi:CobQ/CobB/MinD/ParA nucleotide binding domain
MAKTELNGNNATQGPAKLKTSVHDIHMTLQGKGGVGKSFVASLMAQYLMHKGAKPRCFDTDPVNHTLAGFKAFNARAIELLKDNALDPIRFEEMVILMLEEDGPFIVDNGASSFIAVWDYIVRNGIRDVLKDHGRRLYIHTVLQGGEAQQECLHGFRQVAEMAEPGSIIVWENRILGPIEYQGKTFQDMKVYQNNSSKVLGAIQLPENELFIGNDLKKLTTEKLTLEEAQRSPLFNVISKKRLQLYQRSVFEQMDNVWEVIPEVVNA